MSTLLPKHLAGWTNFTATIDAPQVREEFLNLYAAINGELDAENLKDGAVTTPKLADGSVTDAKIHSLSADKLTGHLPAELLPDTVLYNTGGTLSGTLLFETADPLLKTYSDTPVVLLEAGTGENKLTLTFHPAGDALELRRGDTVLLTLRGDGTLVPRKFQLPVV